MNVFEVLPHPIYEVILEDTLYQLVQQIRSDDLVYIPSWKVRRVGLKVVSTS